MGKGNNWQLLRNEMPELKIEWSKMAVENRERVKSLEKATHVKAKKRCLIISLSANNKTTGLNYILHWQFSKHSIIREISRSFNEYNIFRPSLFTVNSPLKRIFCK